MIKFPEKYHTNTFFMYLFPLALIHNPYNKEFPIKICFPLLLFLHVQNQIMMYFVQSWLYYNSVLLSLELPLSNGGYSPHPPPI